MRTVTFDVPPQEILTRDSVTIHVDAIMYYKVLQIQSNQTCKSSSQVSDATSCIANVDDYGQSTRLLAATTLR